MAKRPAGKHKPGATKPAAKAVPKKSGGGGKAASPKKPANSRPVEASSEAKTLPATPVVDVIRTVFELAQAGQLQESMYVAVLAKIRASGNLQLAEALTLAWTSGKR